MCSTIWDENYLSFPKTRRAPLVRPAAASQITQLIAPYFAARVTGALFHTQGGLVVDTNARVLRGDGTPLPNLFAGGGAARGLSGATVEGYLSGNGLLTAVALGRIAGINAAAVAAA